MNSCLVTNSTTTTSCFPGLLHVFLRTNAVSQDCPRSAQTLVIRRSVCRIHTNNSKRTSRDLHYAHTEMLKLVISVSHVDFCNSIGSSTGEEGLGWVESYVIHRLVELFPMNRQFLDARLRLDVPQSDGAVVTWKIVTLCQHEIKVNVDLYSAS